MPSSTSTNDANGTYSVDGGEAIPFEINGKEFIQGPHCKDERILFQTQNGQLQAAHHNMEVVYNGDDTKMPLCSSGLQRAGRSTIKFCLS